MSAYGKDLIADQKQFESWVKTTTREILNEGCEDENEITEILSNCRPKSFPAIAAWVYFPRIHQIYVEWIFPEDFQLTPTVNSDSPDSVESKEGAK